MEDALAEMRCRYCGVCGSEDDSPCVELALAVGSFVTHRRHVYVIASARLRGVLKRAGFVDDGHSGIPISPQSLR